MRPVRTEVGVHLLAAVEELSASALAVACATGDVWMALHRVKVERGPKDQSLSMAQRTRRVREVVAASVASTPEFWDASRVSGPGTPMDHPWSNSSGLRSAVSYRLSIVPISASFCFLVKWNGRLAWIWRRHCGRRSNGEGKGQGSRQADRASMALSSLRPGCARCCDPAKEKRSL